MNGGSPTNEGPPQKRLGLSALLERSGFPTKVSLPQKVVSGPSISKPFGNLEDAERFLKALAGDGPVTFQTFTDKKTVPLPPDWQDPLKRIIHGSFKQKASYLASLNRKGAGIFLMLNEGDLKGRANKNVIKIRAVFSDLDGAPLTPVEQCKLPPHIITETSCGKNHGIWIVSDMPLDRFGIIQKAIAARFNSDSSVTDLARVVRIPGFLHQKGEPFQSRLLVCNDLPPYTTDQIVEGLEIADLIKQMQGEKGSRKTADFSTGKILYPNRHKHLMSKQGKMRFDGLSEEAIEAALQKENEVRCDPPLEASEVTMMRQQYEHQAKTLDPTALPKGKEYHPMPYVQAITEEFAVIAHEGEFYRYKEGVYELWPSQEIDQLILQLSLDWARPRHLDEIRKLMESVCYVRADLVNPPGKLNLKNGILDPATGELCPHSPDYYHTVQIPVEWNPEATCPLFFRFLKEVLPDKEQRILLLEMFGYALTTDVRYETAFLLLGGGANGKSVCVNILEALLGPACSAIALTDLKSQFLVAELRNKTANFSSEINVKDFVEDATLKKIISGDALVAQRKFKDPFRFRPFSKLIVTANSLPKTYDRSHGYFRRLIILPFEITIREERRDRTLARRIIETELSGVLRHAVEALGKLYEDDGFTIPESSRKALADYEREMNPILVFLEELIEERRGSSVSLMEVYCQYQMWCQFNGHKEASSRKLREEFEKKFGVRATRMGQGRIFRGFFCRKVEWYRESLCR